MIFRSIAVICILFTIGCASYFKRKECNKTNWYNHGKSVAMKGQRLDTDSFMNSCVKVEADVNYANADLGFKAGMGDYCKPTTAYKYGKKGVEFNFNMCDGAQTRQIKEKHAAGVIRFCQQSNGFRVGVSGTVYNDICPENLETAFLSEYYKGRKKHLGILVRQKKSEIVGFERKLIVKRKQKTRLDQRLDTMRVGRTITRSVVAIGTGGRKGIQTNVTEDKATKKRRKRISSDLSRVKRGIINLERKIQKSQNEVQAHEKEMMSL